PILPSLVCVIHAQRAVSYFQSWTTSPTFAFDSISRLTRRCDKLFRPLGFVTLLRRRLPVSRTADPRRGNVLNRAALAHGLGAYLARAGPRSRISLGVLQCARISGTGAPSHSLNCLWSSQSSQFSLGYFCPRCRRPAKLRRA